MYKILSNGSLISLCAKPRYVKINENNGTYIESTKEDAIGVSIYGNLYNLPGKTTIPDRPEAMIVQDDSEEYIFRNRTQIAENKKNTNISIVKIENAMCDLDTLTAEKLITLENALCELDSAINERSENR